MPAKKIGMVSCGVPRCTRSWELAGPRQGFVHAAARRHASCCWERFHDAKKHLPLLSLPSCEECKAAGRNYTGTKTTLF